MRRLILYALLVPMHLFAQENKEVLTQTVRGKAIDVDSKMPMIGANVIIVGSNPILGASCDIDGYFVIENVPVGRVDIQLTAIGYETQVIPNIIVESGKETFVNISATEAYTTLGAVTVTAKEEKNEVLNKMATISAKMVTVEETGRYAGSLNDPARMVTSFAGVTTEGSGNNEIVVRGNSPRGILWRLEGVDIPNPNHFSLEGSSGGAVSVLNQNMLASSDFFTSAYAPEYGNATSGIFDVRFRTGNNQKHEQAFTLATHGTEINLEGPFSKTYNGSYLVNYRYSTLELLNRANVIDFGGIPKYQDASFKTVLPTKKVGNFTLFGLWGTSAISNEEKDEVDEVIEKRKIVSDLYVIGLKHNYIINSKAYIQSYYAQTGSFQQYDNQWKDYQNNQFFDAISNESSEQRYIFSTNLNFKFNSRNTFKIGYNQIFMNYDVFAKYKNTSIDDDNVSVDSDGSTALIQMYLSWKLRLRENVTVVSGLHYTQLTLNNNFTVEPRVGLKWDINPANNLSFGFGMHSKAESPAVYMSSEYANINKNLELMKSIHYVLGFNHQFTPNLFFKSELYYQHLYDVPVSSVQSSSFSILNESAGFISEPLINKGTGANYGIELTLERFFADGYYFLITNSLYESKYKAIDKEERNTKYNANYTSNVVFGKEFQLPAKKNNQTIAVNLKASLLGGNRYSEIDLASSIAANETVYYDDKIYTEKADDVFFVNLGVTYRLNRKKSTHEFKIDIQNLTNNSATVLEYYSIIQQKVLPVKQLGFVPGIMYTVKF